MKVKKVVSGGGPVQPGVFRDHELGVGAQGEAAALL